MIAISGSMFWISSVPGLSFFTIVCHILFDHKDCLSYVWWSWKCVNILQNSICYIISPDIILIMYLFQMYIPRSIFFCYCGIKQHTQVLLIPDFTPRKKFDIYFSIWFWLVRIPFVRLKIGSPPATFFSVKIRFRGFSSI